MGTCELQETVKLHFMNFILIICLPLGCIVAWPIALLLYTSQTIRHYWFSFAYPLIANPIQTKLNQVKAVMFQDMKSYDNKQNGNRHQNSTPLQLLEIGSGPGYNFVHYPKGTEITALDVNPYFQEYYESNKSKFSHVTIQKFITGGAEKMDQIPDGSIDVVVATHVLCSVDDVSKVLKEIKRVLKNGGKYYMLEHVGHRNKAKNMIQLLLDPFWYVVAARCHLRRPIEALITKAGFSQTIPTAGLHYSDLSIPLPVSATLWGVLIK